MAYNALAGVAPYNPTGLVDYMRQSDQQRFQNALATRQQAGAEQELQAKQQQMQAQQAKEKQTVVREFIAAGIANLDSVQGDPVQWARVADTIAAHPIARELGVTRDQITPENVAQLRAQIGIALPTPKSTDPGELVQVIGENGQPIYRTRSEAIGQQAYVKPEKATSREAPSGYQWTAGGLAPIPGGPADPQGPAAKRQVAPLRKEFRALESVKAYESVLPLVKSAAKAPDTGYGDLQLIYTAGKVLDPGSVVREGELALTIAAGSPLQRILGVARFTTELGGRLPSKSRQQIMEMLNERADAYRSAYEQDYQTYTEYAQNSGINPMEVTGKRSDEAYKPTAQARKSAPQAAVDYLRTHPDQINAFMQKYGYRPSGY